MIDWIIAIISLVGTIVNITLKNRICFVLWLPANCLFFVRDYNNGIYAQAALMLVYMGLSVYGFISWGKHDKS